MHDLTLRPAARGVRAFARRLAGCTSGLALTEFAFSLPVLLTLGLAGMETANLAMVHLRVSNIAVLTADNASRVRDSIDEADVIEVFSGAKRAGANINFATRGRIILSSLEFNGTKQWIRWQRCDGTLNVAPSYRPKTAAGSDIVNGTEIYNADRTTAATTGASSPTQSNIPSTGMANTGMSGSTNRIAAQSGTAVMVVEVTYTYDPIIPSSWLEGRQIRYSSSFNVRQRTDQALKNGGQITPRRCDQFNA